MANKNGKKRDSKEKVASKKTTPVKDAAEKKTTTKKSTAKKKPASFSRNVATKSTPKKSSAKKNSVKKEVPKEEIPKKEAPKEEIPKKEAPKKVEKSDSGFSEFETLKLGEVEKLDSKIILRDVTREKPIEHSQPTIQPEAKEPEAKIISSPKPISAPKPITTPKPTAKEIKELEISKAISNAAKLPATNIERRKRSAFGSFGFKRLILAVACVTTAVFAVMYFVNLTSTDMSLKVAAMQSGIDVSYPSFIPRGYNLSDVTSGSGKVSMHFKNNGEKFGITEEASSWDSEGLVNNFIKPTYGNDYSVIREQGLTLYMGDNWAAWVNGGILYKLSVESGSLTKKQIKSIAASL